MEGVTKSNEGEIVDYCKCKLCRFQIVKIHVLFGAKRVIFTLIYISKWNCKLYFHVLFLLRSFGLACLFISVVVIEVYLTLQGGNGLQITYLLGSFKVSQQMNSKPLTDLESVRYYAHNKSVLSSMNAPLSLKKTEWETARSSSVKMEPTWLRNNGNNY